MKPCTGAWGGQVRFPASFLRQHSHGLEREVAQNQRTHDDAVNAECREVVLLDVAMRNLMEITDTTNAVTMPTTSTAISVWVMATPANTNFATFTTPQPNITGMARKT